MVNRNIFSDLLRRGAGGVLGGAERAFARGVQNQSMGFTYLGQGLSGLGRGMGWLAGRGNLALGGMAGGAIGGAYGALSDDSSFVKGALGGAAIGAGAMGAGRFGVNVWKRTNAGQGLFKAFKAEGMRSARNIGSTVTRAYNGFKALGTPASPLL